VVEAFLQIMVRQPDAQFTSFQQEEPANLDGSPHQYRTLARNRRQRRLIHQGA
jgi:hypothetical protein